MAEARLTGDGSYTLFHPQSGECFHSHKGALTESEYVFIWASKLDERLAQAKAQEQALTVLEMGLGTGLNYLLTARAALAAGVPLEYHALEIALLQPAALELLHYELIPDLAPLLIEFSAQLACWQGLSPGLHRTDTQAGSLKLYLGDAREVVLPERYFELCYFDAFSPASAPELWQQAQLQRYFDCLRPGGSWVSYCAQGAVRRSLLACDFDVDRLLGPPGKREMLRANRRPD